LEHGFGFEGDGRVVGDLLLEAVRTLGQISGVREHLHYIRGHGWLINSENVRLQYFSELAEDVERNHTQPAVNHFSNPKRAIVNWFNWRVDNLPTDNASRKFADTAHGEFEKVVQEVRNKKDCNEIKSFVNQYLTQVEDVSYNPGVDFESIEAPEHTFKIFQDAVLKRLDEGKSTLAENIEIARPSTLVEVTNLLGCTEHCFWCGSLCWGQNGHEDNCDDTRKHHACHQPQGLKGTRHQYQDYLLAESCHEISEDWRVFWKEFKESGMLWGEAKLHKDFAGWTFTEHSKSEFTGLMKWFFLKLHAEIAASRDYKPALQSDLEKLKFHELPQLEHILSTIRSRI